MDLTVAICMYNAERFVRETLECLARQSRQDFELLIVNDCSTDNSVDVVRSFFDENPRQYKLVTMPVNQGLAAGRRWVELNATTKYLLFVDADDCPLPRFVEKLYDKISSDDDLIAVGCHLGYINIQGKPMRGGIFLGETTKGGFYTKASKEKLIFMASTSIYDRKVALSVGGHNTEGFPVGKPRYQDMCEDLDLWTRMSDLYRDKKAIVVIPEVLYRYRKGDGMSMNSTNMIMRMRHIKTNLKRRRRGQSELSFIDVINNMPPGEMKRLRREAKGADNLRRAYYAARKFHFWDATTALIASVIANPGYIVQKVKHNLLRIK